MQRTREEELEYKKNRQKYIGGSDMGALLDIAPDSWEVNSKLKLYLAKTQELTLDDIDPFVKPILTRGKRWEGAVGEMFVERLENDGHKVKITGNNKTWRHPIYEHHRCETDMDVLLDDSTDVVTVEIKTVNPWTAREWGESDTDEAPIHYLAQCQWGLGITGRKTCLLAALFGLDDLRVFIVQRDDGLINTLRQTAQAFWIDHVLARKPPEARDLSDINAFYRKDLVEQKDFSDVLPFRNAYSDLVAADNALAAAKAKREEAEAICKRFMGDTGVALLFGKPAITWKSHNRSSIAVDSLRNLYPTIARECSQTTTVRPFKLSRSKK